MRAFEKLEKCLDFFNSNVIVFIRFFVYLTLIIIILIKTDCINQRKKILKQLKFEPVTNEYKLNFEGFNNETGCDELIVPNIVHYVNLKQSNMQFPLFLSILSVWLNQRPDYIYLHCDECDYNGKYWQELSNFKELRSIIKINRFENISMKIFNQPINFIHHKSDVLRLVILMNFGGIYLDNDMLVINSLNKYRNFEITVSWDSDQDGIGNQIIIGHKNARLLRSMFDGYRDSFQSDQWYYNAGNHHIYKIDKTSKNLILFKPKNKGFYPAGILLKHRYLAHSVKYSLGTQMLISQLYKTREWNDWKKMDSIHLLINHRSYLDKESSIKNFDELNIVDYPFTFGVIARNILNKTQIKF